jgi:hypothetical protein
MGGSAENRQCHQRRLVPLADTLSFNMTMLAFNFVRSEKPSLVLKIWPEKRVIARCGKIV